MASMFDPLPRTVRLLDAGAGAGALTLAFVSRCCEKRSPVRAIEATLYEVDSEILEALEATMRECGRRCREAGIPFTFFIHHRDFIQEMSRRLSGDLFGAAPPAFDAAIANPPYRKISNSSAERHALRAAGIETSNLYTGFVALIHRLLAPGGQLVAITPRSFCNGPYFRPFREDLLQRMALRRLHVFESRKAAFREDAVLQENVIFHAVRGLPSPRILTVSSSSGETGASVTETKVPFTDIIHPQDTEKFIHIPSTSGHSDARAVIESLGTSLADLGIMVSTGRVVDFRHRGSLRQESEQGTVPLLYPCHFNGGTIHWPKDGVRKPNAIIDNIETRPWLVPSGTYLLTKRFTSKEERRRLVACLFDRAQVKAEWLGFENHLNYFHAHGRGLDPDLAAGLFAFLNSTVVDQYFRSFSGHTQVNATDLRTLSYPSWSVLQDMGRALPSPALPQTEIDQLVTSHLHAR